MAIGRTGPSMNFVDLKDFGRAQAPKKREKNKNKIKYNLKPLFTTSGVAQESYLSNKRLLILKVL